MKMSVKASAAAVVRRPVVGIIENEGSILCENRVIIKLASSGSSKQRKHKAHQYQTENRQTQHGAANDIE